MSASPIVACKDLRYVYTKGSVDGSRTEALAGLDFEVQAGEVFGILGPNGAGKTTLVKILTTILRPTSGRAWVAGHDVAREPLATRKNLCAVLQENAVETMLSVWDNLLLYGYLHGYARERSQQEAQRVVELLELQPYLKQKAQSLSGGYKRRLQMAKALMVRTPVLFLDEATTGMDPLIKRRALEAIGEEARNGRTVLLTTQLLDEAEILCDRMLLMNHGKAIASGTLEEIRRRSHKAFSIYLSFERPSPEALAHLRSLAPRSLREEEHEFELIVEGKEDEWIQKMAALSARFPLSRFEIRAASLEQIFVELYGAKPEPERQELSA
ncbi:MAG: ABC transporter ATP-binding protein [Acidobacteriales bacterium]|nr:ABC transporter ATP-binding protein [Terriglobales bacterium]